jgi:hypothetical protein
MAGKPSKFHLERVRSGRRASEISNSKGAKRSKLQQSRRFQRVGGREEAEKAEQPGTEPNDEPPDIFNCADTLKRREGVGGESKKLGGMLTLLH